MAKNIITHGMKNRLAVSFSRESSRLLWMNEGDDMAGMRVAAVGRRTLSAHKVNQKRAWPYAEHERRNREMMPDARPLNRGGAAE